MQKKRKKIIKIALADDHELFRKGVMAFLDQSEEMRFVIEASSGLELLESLKTQRADVAIVDYEMPELDGAEATRKIKSKYPSMKVIALTMHKSDKIILHLIESGINGFLSKDLSPKKLLDAIYGVLDNDFYFNETVSTMVLRKLLAENKIKPRNNNANELSEKELQIIKLICQEKTNKEMADLLHLSQRTIEGLRVKILEKINAKNAAGIVMYAIKNNIVSR